MELTQEEKYTAVLLAFMASVLANTGLTQDKAMDHISLVVAESEAQMMKLKLRAVN